MAQIQVTVVEGRNFKKKDFFSENDPYVEFYFDDKSQKYKTAVKRNTKNPRWNQSFVVNHLHGQDTLNVNVYDKDTVAKDKLGFIAIDLHELYEKKHIDRWYDLQGKSYPPLNGEIHLIFDYQRLKI